MSFGKYLRNLRTNKDMSLRDLADRVGISFPYLSKLETDAMSPPSEETLMKLARELNTDTDEIILAAKKIPADISEIIINNPQMIKVIRSINDKGLNEGKWSEIHELIEKF